MTSYDTSEVQTARQAHVNRVVRSWISMVAPHRVRRPGGYEIENLVRAVEKSWNPDNIKVQNIREIRAVMQSELNYSFDDSDIFGLASLLALVDFLDGDGRRAKDLRTQLVEIMFGGTR